MDQSLAWEDFTHRWRLFKILPEIVDQKFDTTMEYADNAIRVANELITRLLGLAGSLRLMNINIPWPTLTPPVIDENLSELLGKIPKKPDINPQWPNLEGELGLDTAIRTKLLTDIQSGGPAIPVSVEQAIFQREEERARLVHLDALDRISSEWSKRRFTLPNAILASQINEVEINYINKRLDVSRDIAIKSFELGDTNTKFAIQQGIAFLMQKVEVYKAKIQAEISRIEGIVKAFLGEIEGFKSYVGAYASLVELKIKKYEGEIKAAVAQADVTIKDAEIDMRNYSTIANLQIEAMRAVGSINAQVVAGALSAVSAGVNLGVNNSSAYNYTTSASTSISTIYSY